MSPEQNFLEVIGKVLERVGFLPPDGSDEYYGYGPACDMHGDVRDCSDEEERRKYFEIFCDKPPNSL